MSTGVYPDVLKRGLDVALAIGACVFFLPLMVLIYCLVRLDGGPGLFAHRRIGRDGREFRCLKFRTMVVDAEATLSHVLGSDPAAREEWEKTRKLRMDPRVTAIGKLLRKSSADELPQFLNVVLGDMSIVGPRPVTRSELERYGRGAAAYLAVRPGITGLWQVSGRNDASYQSRVELDNEYCRKLSLKLDVLLMLKTFVVVLKREGAY